MAYAGFRLEPSPSPYAGDSEGNEVRPSWVKTGNAVATVTAALFPADAKPGDACELIVTLDIKDGWRINANPASAPFLIPTQVDVQGKGIVELLGISPILPRYAKPAREGEMLLVYEGLINVTARLRLQLVKAKNAHLSKR